MMQLKNPDIAYCKECGRRLLLNTESIDDLAGGALNGLCITCENKKLRELYTEKALELSATRAALIDARKKWINGDAGI